jgi:hypothetical protein
VRNGRKDRIQERIERVACTCWFSSIEIVNKYIEPSMKILPLTFHDGLFHQRSFAGRAKIHRCA